MAERQAATDRSDDPPVRFENAVVAVIAALEPGDLISYGEVAAEAGFPGAARAVGRVLKSSTGLPWWRVVTSTGRLVPGLEAEQARLLELENVMVLHGRVVR